LESNDTLVPESHLFVYNEGSYSEISSNIISVFDGCSGWADFDLDGDQDLILSGVTAVTNNGWQLRSTARLYLNMGNGEFEDTESGIKGVFNCKLAIADYDNDHYPDILITGELYDDGGDWRRTTYLYKNNGDHTFSPLNAGLPALRGGDVDFGDFDNDGHTDILLNGDPTSPTNLVYVFRNDGNGNFYDIGIEIIGTVDGTANWIDYDNDGDLDFLITGLKFPSSDVPISEIYKNAGNNMFSNDHITLVDGMMFSSVSWGDMDGDHDPDLVMMGYTDKEMLVAKTLVYTNISNDINTVPLPPSTLAESLEGDNALLFWGPGFDAETSVNGLSYNIRLGSSPAGTEIISPMSLEDGRRQLMYIGNAGQSGSKSISGLSEGTYYWSVQSIDHAYIGSVFSEERAFSISPTGNIEINRKAEYSLEIYPVPASNHLSLKFISDAAGLLDLQIINTSGHLKRELNSIPVQEGQNKLSLELENIPSGTYILLLLKSGRFYGTEKFIILSE